MKDQEVYRSKDAGWSRYYYWNEFYVRCPKCSGRGIVEKDRRGYYGSAKFSCRNCYYHLEEPLRYYDLVVKLFCSNCAEKIHQVIEDVSEKKEHLSVKCPGCEKAHRLKPRYIEKATLTVTDSTPKDPYYGFPLWLTEGFKKDIFWAYNYEHLSHIRRHIAAQLRQKYERYNGTMLEKLPSWILNKKHRSSILKLIDRLEKK